MNREQLQARFQQAARKGENALHLGAGQFTDADFADVVGSDDFPALPRLEMLDVSFTQISHRGLKALRQAGDKLTALNKLHLSGCVQLTDDGLQHLAGNTALFQLNLDGCEQLTDDGLRHLAGLTALTELYLGGCKQLTDDGLQHLAGLNALTELSLSGCIRLTDDGLQHLAGLTALTQLNLNECEQLTDDGLQHLAGLTALTQLNLNECEQLTDDGLQHLAGLTALTELDLYRCKRLTDDGLRHLAGLTALTRLNLIGCNQLTDDGLRILAEAAEDGKLPNLKQLDVSISNTQVTIDEATLETQGARAIFAAVLAGSALPVVRVALVGMGRVGKSSLFSPLFLDEPLERERFPESTHDVEIVRPEAVRWQPEVEIAGQAVAFQPHVWDFGGQLVLHGVHEEFLRPDARTVYLLVVAANRRPQHDRDAEAGNRLDYWLHTIGRFAGPEAPLIVAISQCDRYKEDEKRPIDEPLRDDCTDPLYRWEPTALAEHAAPAAAVNVRAIVDGCSALPNNENKVAAGVVRVREAITAAMGDMPGLRAKVPRSILELIQRVQTAWKTQAVVPKAEFNRWAAETGDLGHEVELEILRNLGVVFYFGRTANEQGQIDAEAERGTFPDWLGTHPPGERRHLHDEPDGLLKVWVFNPHWLAWPLYAVIRQSEQSTYMTRREVNELLNAGVAKAAEGEQGFPPPDNALDLLTAVLNHTGLCLHLEDEQRYFFPPRPADHAAAGAGLGAARRAHGRAALADPPRGVAAPADGRRTPGEPHPAQLRRPTDHVAIRHTAGRTAKCKPGCKPTSNKPPSASTSTAANEATATRFCGTCKIACRN